jgi:hypothetical protein
VGALSDGYRAFIGWISDLLYHVCMGAPAGAKLVDGHGIVLIDEVDLHLHPEWQRHVIPTLARALPNLQLIMTSHSPIVVGTLYQRNVVVLESGQNATQLCPATEEVYGRSADQILTSGHFGLSSARNEEFVGRLTKTAHDARSDPEAALTFLRMMALGGAADPQRPPARGRAAVIPIATGVKITKKVAAKKAPAKKAPAKRATKAAKRPPAKKAAKASPTGGKVR